MSTNRAFEVDSILIDEKTGLVAFDIDPITVGFSAPIGSLGMRTNGLHYRKTGAADIDWTLIDDQTAAEIEAIVSHDNLLDFLSTEHYPQSTISITLSQVSDSGSAAALDTGILSGNIPLIGAGNVLPTSIMPALTITETTVVTSEAEQLALTVQEGDVAVRTDLSETYIALNDVNADMGDWQELLSPTSDVTSVFGRTGPVTAEQADYDAFFLTPAEGNAAYLGIGAKAVDSELLDGVDGDNYTREDLTHLGKVGGHGLDSDTDTPSEWSNLPVGYSRMMHSSIGIAGGAPVNNFGYFSKSANRETAGGWAGIWVGHSVGENYMGRAATNSDLANWDKLWSDANDGAGSGLDADLLDGVDGANYARTDIAETFDTSLTIRKDGTGQDILILQSDLGVNDRSMQIRSPVVDNTSSPFVFHTNNAFSFEIDNSEKLLIDDQGVIHIKSGGIRFPVAQVPSADPNTQDDYEEGDWDCILRFGGNSVGITYSGNLGRYTKNGNIVVVSIWLRLSNKGSSTGTADFAGLPFTQAGSNAYRGGVAIGYITSINNGIVRLRGELANNIIRFNEFTNVALNNTHFVNTSSIMLTYIYLVD